MFHRYMFYISVLDLICFDLLKQIITGFIVQIKSTINYIRVKLLKSSYIQGNIDFPLIAASGENYTTILNSKLNK